MVEFVVLAAIQDVESRAPKNHRRCEDQNSRIERAANRYPRRGGRGAHRNPQHHVRPARKALGERVQEDNGQRHRRQVKRQRVQLIGREDQNRRRHHHEPSDKRLTQFSRRDGANPSSRISGVNAGIRQPVKRHRRRAGRHQRDDDPDGGVQAGNAARRQHRACQSKGERQHRVLPLDHLQGGSNAAKQGHASILTCERESGTWREINRGWRGLHADRNLNFFSKDSRALRANPRFKKTWPTRVRGCRLRSNHANPYPAAEDAATIVAPRPEP